MRALAFIFGVLLLVALIMIPYSIIKGKSKKEKNTSNTVIEPTEPVTEPETPNVEPEAPTVAKKVIESVKLTNYFTETEQRSGEIAHIAITFADGHNEAWEWSAGQFGNTTLDAELEHKIELSEGDNLPINDITIDMWNNDRTEWCSTYDGMMVITLGSLSKRYSISHGGEVIHVDNVYDGSEGELSIELYNE